MRTGLFMLAAFALLIAACARAGEEAVPDALANLGSVQGALIGTTFDGEEIRLGQGALEGKAVILNYFNVN